MPYFWKLEGPPNAPHSHFDLGKDCFIIPSQKAQYFVLYLVADIFCALYKQLCQSCPAEMDDGSESQDDDDEETL